MIKLIRGEVKILNTLVTQEFDKLTLNWTGSQLTQVLYIKDGITVKTLALSYDGGGNLTGVIAT